MKHLAISLILAALLAACAEQPSKDAVIEDRGIKAVAKAEEAKTADTQGMAVAPVETKPIPAKEAAAPGAGGQAPAPVTKVETHALAETAAEVKPLGGGQASAAPASAAPEAGPAAKTGGEQAAIALTLKDPNSPLSKRVILFDFDSSAIRDEYRSLLEAHAAYLKSNPASKVILQGHADERGSREYNLALGQRRAESVYKALSLLGVPEPQMEAVSLGEEKPVALGHDEESWQQNRRTEILYQGE
jgi:peptidoglycan-associated lipoprotein